VCFNLQPLVTVSLERAILQAPAHCTLSARRLQEEGEVNMCHPSGGNIPDMSRLHSGTDSVQERTCSPHIIGAILSQIIRTYYKKTLSIYVNKYKVTQKNGNIEEIQKCKTFYGDSTLLTVPLIHDY
jgi:hypothetical protein